MSSIAVVCEAQADCDTATRLTNRVLETNLDWFDPAAHVEYRGFRASDPLLRWRDVKRIAGEQDITVTGFMRGGPPSPDAHNTFRALLLLARSGDPVDAVLLIRDSDGDDTRREGLEQARDEEPWKFSVVIGLAHTKRECWHLAGFEPENTAEQTALGELLSELGFDPRLRSDELTAKHDPANDKKSAKRVLAALTAGDHDREHRCLDASFGILTARGAKNGLAEFLADIRSRLVPLFGGPPPKANNLPA
jgi:hypothetical protein